MSVSDPFLKRPLLTLVVSVLILLAGLLSLANLDVENLPPIAPSRVSVSANYPGASAEVVEHCLLYTSPSPRDMRRSRMPSSA